MSEIKLKSCPCCGTESYTRFTALKDDELHGFVEGLRKYANIRVKGIMSVMPNVQISPLIEYYKKFALLFAGLENIRGGNVSPDICSCGMSNDYAPAIEYGGSNMVRPGRILFGARNQ